MNGNARRRIRVLHLEDNARDAELIGRRLQAGDFDCELVHAEGKAAFESAIAAAPFDLVLSDYNVPGYGGLLALRLAREKQPEVPFIMLSGELSEEEAVECLRAGASDYLLKYRLQRLVPAVERAVAEADERSKRRQAEFARRASDKRFRLLVKAMAEGVVSEDREGRVLSTNPAAARILGVSEEELQTCRLTDPRWRAMREDGSPFPAEDHPLVVTLHTGEPQTGVVMGLHRADGELRWILINSLPLWHEATIPYGAAVTMHDITERRQAAEAVRESEERFRLMTSSVKDFAIFMLDAQGRVIAWNDGARRLYGHDESDILGERLERFHSPEDVAAGKPADMLRRAAAEGRVDDQGWRVRRNGTLFWAEAVLTALRDERGGLRGYSNAARDVTQRRELEHQLQQAQKMESIGQLTGGLAHDFNNLLGVIFGNLDLLERMLDDNEAALKRVQTAQRAAARGADLTRRLLAFSRRQQLSPKPTSVNDLIDGLLEMLPRTLGPDIKITTRLAEGLPPASIDAAGLENALLNLAINARDAMPDGGTLVFRTAAVTLDQNYAPVRASEIQAGNYVQISVTDTGHGMSRETAERIFEPFFTTKERGKGTGLGLSMVHGFVKQSQGNVRVYSEEGHGTTMNLYFPVAAGEAAVMPADSARKARKTGQGARGTVLVVDDEVDLLEVAVAYLDEMGYRVLIAIDAAEAVQAFEREPGIDLLVTDIMMPGGMNGVALAQELRKRKPALKVVFASGFPSTALAGRNQLHIDGPLVSKPYRREQLQEVVERAMTDGITRQHNTGAVA